MWTFSTVCHTAGVIFVDSIGYPFEIGHTHHGFVAFKKLFLNYLFLVVSTLTIKTNMNNDSIFDDTS